MANEKHNSSVPGDVAALQRLMRYKQPHTPPAQLMGPHVQQFFKQSVQKRQAKFAEVAGAWAALVPAMFNDHCALESLHKGTLTVLVDNSSHLYELKQLLLGGLQQQLLGACKRTGLKKISLKPGRWYREDPDGDRKIRFES
jgi:hypothetical protein